MEFFKEVHKDKLNIVDLKSLLALNNLTVLCDSISNVTALNGNEGDMCCLWGAFKVRREEIRYGVRFSLLNCPHALAWTITFDEESRDIVIHCTIDKREQEPDFIDSIHEFVEDWSSGITRALKISV